MLERIMPVSFVLNFFLELPFPFQDISKASVLVRNRRSFNFSKGCEVFDIGGFLICILSVKPLIDLRGRELLRGI